MSLKDVTNDNKIITTTGLSKYDELMKQHITDRVQSRVKSYVAYNTSNIYTTATTPLGPGYYDPNNSGIVINGGDGGFIQLNATDENGINKTVTPKDLNIGDVIFLIVADVPDWWVSSKSEQDEVYSVTLHKLETQKPNLSDYVTESRFNALSDNVNRNTKYLEGNPDAESEEEKRGALGRITDLENKPIATITDIENLFN